MPPHLDQSFAHTWQADILAAPPLIAPALQVTLPRPVPGEEEAIARGALHLLVRPRGAPSFLATCALGFESPSLPTGLWSCPHPDELCAVAGGYAYIVPTGAPGAGVHIPLRPVTAVRALPAHGLLVFSGFHHLVAWGAEGLRWHTARLSWEGLNLTDVQDGHLHGAGWDMLTDREIPFSVDLATGAHQGSPFPPSDR